MEPISFHDYSKFVFQTPNANIPNPYAEPPKPFSLIKKPEKSNKSSKDLKKQTRKEGKEDDSRKE